MRSTSRFVTFWARVGYRLVPPTSMKAKWKPAVKAIAWRWVVMLLVLSLLRLLPCVRIRSRNRGVLSHIQAWDGLNKGRAGIKIGVGDGAYRVDGQLHKVGKAPIAGRAGCRASRNGDGLRSAGLAPSDSSRVRSTVSTDRPRFCSAAERNCRMAISPLVIGGPLSSRSRPKARAAPFKRRPPEVAAPAAAAPFLKNARRFVLRVKAFRSVFIGFPVEFRDGSSKFAKLEQPRPQTNNSPV